MNEVITIEKTLTDKIDELESVMMQYPAVDCPLHHRFIFGWYVREIFMQTGTWVTSMKHLTEHPYEVVTGKVSVFSETLGEQYLEAPYKGVTKANTRRVLYIHENCLWRTFHKIDIRPKDSSVEARIEAVRLIEDRILDKRENPLLGGRIKNNIITKNISECPSSR